jgi:murein DD-endopeptidase MepM/ murein hydrolase activator NlpD
LSVAEAALTDTRAMLYDGTAGESEELSNLERMVYELQLKIDDVVEAKAGVESENIKLSRRVETLESSATVGYEVHKSIIAGLRTKTAEKVESYEKALSAVGLSINGLRNQAERTKPNTIDLAPPGGTGGPFIPSDRSFEFDEPILDQENHFDIDELWSWRRDILMSLHKMSVLEPRVLATPLANPTRNLRVTSRFGGRKDPLNKKRSMHYGIDFGGKIGSPIYAPASGKIIYAGRKGSFGKFVEIRHGHGIVTRYAHLSKIYVKVGQWVKLNQKIAALGNTGRSTGPHLHYEIRVNGTRHDPLKFIRAARYVQ